MDELMDGLQLLLLQRCKREISLLHKRNIISLFGPKIRLNGTKRWKANKKKNLQVICLKHLVLEIDVDMFIKSEIDDGDVELEDVENDE